MKPVTVRQLLTATSGVLLRGSPDTAFSAVTTDSRAAGAGALFIPLSGERYDGHDFIAKAMEAGAAGFLFSRETGQRSEQGFQIRVADTLAAYQALASWYRGQFTLPMVQVTGSVGKTTAKEMIASVLNQRFRTLKTEANYNNEIGTPRTLLRLDHSYEAAVIETGMDGAGQIRSLGAMVRPTAAVITNIGDMHIEYLGSRENILKAKCEIFEHLTGFAVLNGDDELLRTVRIPQRVVTVGRGADCDVRVSEVKNHGIDGISCVLTSVRRRYEVSIPAPGIHMVYPAAIAVAIGEELGLSAAEITHGISAYEPSGARMRVLRLSGNRRLLDDCYNAGPQSMRAALEVLAASEGQTCAVLGDMAELGELTVPAHREIGALAHSLGIGRVIAIGERARQIAETADRAQWFATVESAVPAVRAAFQADTTMLVKASHSMHFEKITQELLAI